MSMPTQYTQFLVLVQVLFVEIAMPTKRHPMP